MDIDKKEFLELIREIESSGGKNRNHKTMTSGPHEGDTAIGDYGLMPNTVKEVSNLKTGKRQSDIYGHLRKLDNKEIETLVGSDRDLEDKLANDLADIVLSKSKSDDRAAFRWNQGHNIERVPASYRDKDYVEKYLNAKDNKGYGKRTTCNFDKLLKHFGLEE